MAKKTLQKRDAVLKRLSANVKKHGKQQYFHEDHCGEKLRLTMPDKVEGNEELFEAYATLYKLIHSPRMLGVVCSTEPTLASVSRQAERQIKEMNRRG